MEPVEAAQDSNAMKTSSFSSLLAAAVVGLGTITVSQAQEPVSTGTIQGFVPRAGTLTLRSDQTSRPITFYGVDRANIFTEDGQPAVIGDLQTGMKATVQYAVRGKRWYISKIILPGQRAVADQGQAAATGAPLYLDPALRTPAAMDDDITTQPGSKARIDNDITTRPGSSGNGTNFRIRRTNP